MLAVGYRRPGSRPGDPGGPEGRRWGDYSYTSLDPIDDMTMWTIEEFCDATDSWGVRVVKPIRPHRRPRLRRARPRSPIGQPSIDVTCRTSGASPRRPSEKLTEPLALLPLLPREPREELGLEAIPEASRGSASLILAR